MITAGRPCLPLLLAVVSAAAQNAAEPEVRRALPVAVSPSPVQVMRALPVNAPPSPSPLPPASAAAPQESQRVASPISATPAEGIAGSIRLAPADSDPAAAANAQLAEADRFFAGKEAAAVPEYEKFLVMAPKDHPGREKALFRLGESQRLMESNAAAEETFRSLLKSFPSGTFRPAAAFRLGELLDARGASAEAAGLFGIAAGTAAAPEVRQAAVFRQASCLEKTGRPAEADRLFLSLLPSPTKPTPEAKPAPSPSSAVPENPYLAPSLLHLASNAAAAGRKEEAVGYCNRIIKGETGDRAAVAEASMKAALLLSDLGRPDEAAKLLSSVAASPDAGPRRTTALIGLLRMASGKGDDDAVIKISGDQELGRSAYRPEVLFLRAEALRRKERHREALEIYDTVIRDHPADAFSLKAPFQRLLCLHALGSPLLPAEIDRFLSSAPDPGDKARAQLLKAEAALARRDYAGAAVLYGEIDSASLPPKAKPDILYKQAWSLLQSGDRKGGGKALALYLESFPSGERAAPALAQLAVLRQENKDFEGALADFEKLSRNYPQAPERELALQQKALLLGQLRRNDEMVAAFGQLLQEYPNSNAAPQAHYWTGWTAFEAKDYARALTELEAARTGDPKQFGERSGLRILLCHYYLGDAAAAAREAASLKPSLIPPEAGRWLGQQALSRRDHAVAERYLAPLAREGMPGSTDPEIQAMLAAAMAGQGKFREAQNPAAVCLKLAREPVGRAKALLLGAGIQLSLKNLQAAKSQADEAMLLQPEGPVNTEARILTGDILSASQDHAGAAKAYMTAALLDGGGDSLALKALERAAESFSLSGDKAAERRAREELHNRQAHAPVSAQGTR
jgi:TolA-binding protein